MFQINLKGAEPVWYNFPEGSTDKLRACRLQIKRYPISKSQIRGRRTKDDLFEIIMTGEDRLNAFCESLVNAEDLQDATGIPIKLNRQIKEYIYNFEFASGIPQFVLKKAGVMDEEVDREEKNSEPGPDGSGQKSN